MSNQSQCYRAMIVFLALTLGLAGVSHAVTPDPPIADPSGINKVRFISFLIPPAPEGEAPETALRVWLVSLHHVDPPYTAGPTVPFTHFEGESAWVGPPSTYPESSGSPVAFQSSWTQCTPHYQDWTTVGLLHVTSALIVPSSIYQVEQVPVACAGVEDACETVSPRLEIRTTRWGDVLASFNPPTNTTQPDFTDITGLVRKFRDHPGSPSKVRSLQIGKSTDPFGIISTATLTLDMNFGQVAAVVNAFRGSGYPYIMGECASSPRYCEGNLNFPCKSDAYCTAEGRGPCAGVPCSTDAECTEGNGPCMIYCP